jgi:hypothetical protein
MEKLKSRKTSSDITTARCLSIPDRQTSFTCSFSPAFCPAEHPAKIASEQQIPNKNFTASIFVNPFVLIIYHAGYFKSR